MAGFGIKYDMGDGVTARRWYQNVTVKEMGIKYEDPDRKESKFWNEGKWNNFIEPLLPAERRTLIEIGCNAGLFLKMAMDAGFKDVIGIEANSRIMDQAKCFKKHNGGTYKLLQRRVGKNLVLDQLPLADVTLLANAHYYFPISVFSKLVDNLKSRTVYCIVVSAKARRRSGNALYDLNSVQGYFDDWQQIKVIENLDEEDDPAPRMGMYGVSFKGNLNVCNVERACDRWHRENSSRHKDLTIFPALEEFFKKVLTGGTFSAEETLLYHYWVEREPNRSHDWILGKLAYKKSLAEDIQINGIRNPLYYDRKGKLLDGIHRLVIAKELGYEHILVRRPKWVTDNFYKKEMRQMARIVLFFKDEAAGKLRRKRWTGQEVDYQEGDEVLGKDFVKIRVDNKTFVIRKENVIDLYIEK